MSPMHRLPYRATICFVLIALSTGAPRIAAQTMLLPDLFFAPERLANNEVNTEVVPGRAVFRFDSSIPNLGPGEFQLEATGVEDVNGRRSVDQRIFFDNGTSTTVDAGDFLYFPPTTAMESETWVAYRIRELLPNNGVGDILSTGAKTSVHITSSTSYDLSLPNVPSPQDRIIASGSVHGISVGYTDIYSRFLTLQWVDVTDLASGDYWLEVELDPGNNIMESNETNNVTRIIVTLDIPIEDDDGDGLSNAFEEMIGLDPNDRDSDNDGLRDDEEVGFDGDFANYNPFDPILNPTGTDTDALNADTDGDGSRDGSEVRLGLDPLNPNDGSQLAMNRSSFLFFLYFLLFIFGILALQRA